MKKIFTLIILLIIAWIGGLIYFGYLINHFDIDKTTHTDVVIALTGGRNRINEATKILHLKLADKLFISGVGKDISLKNIQHRQKIKKSLLKKITIGHDAEDTIGNAKESAIWVEENKISSIRLVTSNYHINRAMIEFRRQLPFIDIIPHPVYSEKIVKKWWTSWQTFSLIFKEYNKLIFAIIRYQLNL